MTAYDQHELAAAKEQDLLDDEALAQDEAERALHEVCEEYALVALEDGTNWTELLEAYHDTTSPDDWPSMYDHLRVLAIREPGTDEYNYAKRQLICTLSRAVDIGCLLED